MLQQAVLIFPSHILPFQTVRSHDFGKNFNNLLSILPPRQNNPVAAVSYGSKVADSHK